MLSYIIRRILLAIPTLIGMTMVVFFVMALSPGKPGAALSREGQLKPQERAALEKYYNERYGLNKPPHIQYFRWLNKVSPVGFKTWRDDDPQVVEAVAQQNARRDAKRKELASSGLSPVQLEREVNKIEVSPQPGDLRLSRPTIKSPDLGESMIRNRRVSALLGDAVPVTLLLNCLTLPLVYSLSIIIGIKAARHRGTLVDVGSGTVLLAMWSFPMILMGLLLQGLLSDRDFWPIFPTALLHDIQSDTMTFLPSYGPEGWQRGYLLDTIWHLILPVVTLAYGSFAFLTKLSRGSVLENINADYVRTARAKGLDEHTVLYRHVLRNSTIPLITFAGYLLPALLGGSIVVETIFSIPGMGRLMVESISFKDNEVVLAVTLVSGVLGLTGYLLADIFYAIADPRVTYD